MEKLSVNDVLALLFPGLFVMLCISIISAAAPFSMGITITSLFSFFEKNEFLSTTFFLLLAIVAGAVVQRVIALIINNKWYNPKAGLYQRTGYIFSTINMLQHWLPFYNILFIKLKKRSSKLPSFGRAGAAYHFGHGISFLREALCVPLPLRFVL